MLTPDDKNFLEYYISKDESLPSVPETSWYFNDLGRIIQEQNRVVKLFAKVLLEGGIIAINSDTLNNDNNAIQK